MVGFWDGQVAARGPGVSMSQKEVVLVARRPGQGHMGSKSGLEVKRGSRGGQELEGKNTCLILVP